ncbi:dihydrolipoyl dehydrogenase family protein [Methylobrevis pamukkalensis]|uniref:Mercuric reductase n=1 Tax=Methylobrevis pamukkalensis TaxID=1439726 RepID=A0A1E3GYQ6_9HYPH|nr:FAD-dependent oxidoreductase [Methylobrevis pamukkalensis]ODN69172.1 Mercuric reductase [Methylobrevis pamukkalensis]
MTTLTPDICIIGAGSAGLTVAAAACAFGVEVVLIEEAAMGGDCLNTGCVPSKALIAAAHHAENFRRAPLFGIDGGAPRADLAKVRDHVRGVIAGIAPHDSAERFEGLGATVIRASARFTGPDTVVAGEATIRARRFVIASGSRAAVPPVPGLGDVPYLTNETVFDLGVLPEHLLVIGGGPIGLELAQAFRRLGAAVTVVESGTPFKHEDADLAAIVRGALDAEGVGIVEQAKVLSVAPAEGGGIRLTLEAGGETRDLAGSHLLVATGRSARIDGLALEAAGVEASPAGIKVDSGLRTSNRRIYAIGDCVAGSFRFTHWAGYHAGLAVRAILFRLPIRENRTILPYCTYTDPEIGRVGLDEASARARFGAAVRVLDAPFSGNDRARAERRCDGLLRIVVGRRGRILGAACAGPGAGEILSLFAVAIAGGLTVQHLASTVFPYPTLSEIAKRAALTYYADAPANPWVRRIVRLLRRFG